MDSLRRLILVLFSLFAFSVAAFGQATTFTPICAGTDDTSKFTAIITATGSNDVTIRIPYKANTAQRCAIAAGFSFPARVALDNTDGSGLKANSGTVTVLGPRINPPTKVMFFGPGSWVTSGPTYASNDLVTASAPGLAPTLPGDPSRYFDGSGAYTVPAGGGGAGGISTINGQTGATQTITTDTNLAVVSAGNNHNIVVASNVVLKNQTNVFTGLNTFAPPAGDIAFKVQDVTGQTITHRIPAGLVSYDLYWPTRAQTGQINLWRVTAPVVGTTTISLSNNPWTTGEGGTGKITLGANNLLVGAGTAAVGEIAPGTAGWALTSDGTTPAYRQLTVTGIATSALSGTGTKLGTILGSTASGKCLEWDALGNIVTAASGAACGTGTGGGGGSLDTVSNIGSAGVGVFSAIVGTDAQLKTINASTTKISVTNNAGLNSIDLDVPTGTTSQLGAVQLSISGTSVAVGTTDPRVPTQDENDALPGYTYGGALILPSAFNPYLTVNDPRIVMEKPIQEYGNDLVFAVSILGSTRTTVVIPSTVAVTSNVTVPATLNLRFTGAGSLTVSSGVVVTMATGRIMADPHQQIFFATNTNTGSAGTGKVRFTGETPVLSAKWWGAKGDGPTTDDTVAIKAALASVDANISGEDPAFYKRGAILEFPIPSTYYLLSSTIDVYRPMWIRGTGSSSGSNAFTTRLNWNVATTGFKFHRYNTLPGFTGTQSDGAILQGLELVGTFSGNTGTANVSGLTVTRVTGPNFNEDFNSGYVITINGWEYVVQTLTNANSLAVYKPRLRVAATNGSPTVTLAVDWIPNLPTGDWNGQAIKIDGVSYTISSHTASTITLSANYTGTTATSIDAQVQTTAALTGAATILNKFHGVDSYAQVALRDVSIRNFSGNGVNMDTSTVPFAAPAATDTNANNSHIERVLSLNNKGHGILTRGTNSNNITIDNFNGQNNRGAGIMDISFLGNTWEAPHLASNRFAPFFSDAAISQSTILGMYSEDGQPSNVGSQFSLNINGDQGSRWARPNQGYNSAGGFGGANITTDTAGSGYTSMTPIIQRRLIGDNDGTNPTVATSLFLGEMTASYSTVLGFGAGNDTASNGGSFSAASPGLAYRLTYCVAGSALGAGWWTLSYNDPTCADATKSVMSFSGSAASVGAAKIQFPNVVGIGTGNPTVRLGQKLDIATSANFGGMALSTWSTSASEASAFDFNRSKSATIGTHSALALNDAIGGITFRGSDGTGFGNAALIKAFVDNTVATNQVPGRLEFSTASSAGTLTERMRITSAGNVGIGDASPAALFTVGNGDLFQVSSAGVVTSGYTTLTPGAGNTPLWIRNTNVTGQVAGQNAGIYIDVAPGSSATPAVGDVVGLTVRVSNLVTGFPAAGNAWAANFLMLQDPSGPNGGVRVIESEVACTFIGGTTDPWGGGNRCNNIEVVSHSASIGNPASGISFWAPSNSNTQGWFQNAIGISRTEAVGILFSNSPGGTTDTVQAFQTAAIHDNSQSSATIKVSGNHNAFTTGSVIDLSDTPTVTYFVRGSSTTTTNLNFANGVDQDLYLTIASGAGTIKEAELTFYDATNLKWKMGKNGNNDFIISNGSNISPILLGGSTTGAFAQISGMATPVLSVTLANGANHNVAVVTSSGATTVRYNYIRIGGPSGAFSITGFANALNGYTLTVYNSVAQAMSFDNLSASSTAGNKIVTMTGGTVTLAASISSATFIYDLAADSGNGAWVLLSARDSAGAH